MDSNEARQNWTGRIRRSILRFDAPVLLFILFSWVIIFFVATLALERDKQGWLPINFAPEVSADYGVDEIVLKSAPVDPDIIEAKKRDAELEQTPVSRRAVAFDVSPTPTGSPTPTPTSSPGRLTVSAGGPYEGDEGSPITVAADGFNSTLDILPENLTYLWDLDNDGEFNDARGITTTVTYGDEGDYAVGLQARDLLGRVATDLALVTVFNAPPIVDIRAEWYGNEAEEIEFVAQARDPGDDILFFEWHFGDGTIRSGSSRIKHAYPEDGGYEVMLRVRDNDGGLTEKFLTALIANLPPEVDPGSDKVVDEGSTVTFQGSAEDPAGDWDDLTYAWDFDYQEGSFTPDADGSRVSTIYPDGPADFTAALLVKDDDDGETLETVDVTVNNVPPVINSVSNNGPVGEGSQLTVEVQATDAGPEDILTYAFDWNNDGTYETENQSASASNIWPNQGDYSVAILVDDGDGGLDSITTTVSAFNLPPIAVAQGPATAKFEGDSVAFSGADSSDPGVNDVLTYQWNFGDDSTATGIQPTHVYADNRVYSTTLTVTDDSGDFSTASVPVTILNANPVVSINQPSSNSEITIDEGENVNFTFNGTATDPGSGDTLTYAWDMDGDGTFETVGQSKDKTYSQLDGPQEFQVTFRVRDDDYPYPTNNGGQIGEAIDKLKVIVKNVPPSVDAGGPYKGVEGQIITLAGSANDISDDPLTYQWDLNNDGTFETPGKTVTNTWATFGNYTVKLRVEDGDGGSNTDEATVSINAVPTAVANVTPNPGSEGTDITFDGSNSSDPNDNNASLTYQWNFGDGSTGTGQTVTHSYADNGEYTAILTVTDGAGSSDTDSVAVTISNVAPTADAGGPYSADEDVQLTLTGTATDPGTADTLSYAWDFDYDGATFDVEATTLSAVTKYFDGPASYTVAFRVQDDDGATDLATSTVTVNNKAPIVDAGGPYSGTEGQSVTLTGSAADAPLDVPSLQYEWDLDNNGNFETAGQTVNNTWSTGGQYTVGLQVTDKDGGIGTDTAQVDINFMPTADPGGPYSGNEGSAIALDQATASDPDSDPLTYAWTVDSPLCNFSDPTVLQAEITCNDDRTNDYTLTLTVNDGQGGTVWATTTVDVNNLPPIANAGGPYSGNEGVAVNFDGSGSSDPGINDTLTYAWDFGDGSPVVTTTDPTVPHAYPDGPVTYTVVLRMEDDDSGVVTDTAQVTINNVAPIASIAFPNGASGTEDQSIPLTGMVDDVSLDVPFTYEWDFDYDGIFNVELSQVNALSDTVTNTWDSGGLYTIGLRVTDKDGISSTIATAQVDINSVPTATFTITPTDRFEGSPITFDASGSDDPDGDPLTYSWDFGDGNSDTGPNVSYPFADDGTYQVTLTVDDGQGGTDTATVDVTVQNVAPTANASGPPSGNEGIAINLDGSGSSDPGNDIATYSWDFGDGNSDSGVNVSHTYADDGNYTVTLTVTDDDGASNTDTINISIQNVAPTANAGGPYGGNEGDTINFDGSGSSDPGNDIASYSWDFGDGNSGSGANASHVYADDGTYTATLTVTDDDGATGTDTVQVTINNVDPTASASADKLTVVPGEVVTFDGTATDPGNDSLTYRWDFDYDGSNFNENKAGQTVTNTWAATGTYTVALEVNDGDGGLGLDTVTIQVNSLLPLIWLGPTYLIFRRKKITLLKSQKRNKKDHGQ